jgi:hypothetical protein
MRRAVRGHRAEAAARRALWALCRPSGCHCDKDQSHRGLARKPQAQRPDDRSAGVIGIPAKIRNFADPRMTKFQKGQSGNPRGRAKGSRNRTTLLVEQIFEERLFGKDRKADVIIAKAIELAANGDVACIRLCFDRMAPARKDRPVCFELPKIKDTKDALGASAAIVDAVAAGELTPSEAAELAKVLDSYTRVLQAAEFETRLQKLEKATGL